jgi:hypothetical protein
MPRKFSVVNSWSGQKGTGLNCRKSGENSRAVPILQVAAYLALRRRALVFIRGIVVGVERQDFEEIVAPSGYGAHFLYDADGMELRPVRGTPAVNEFAPEAFVGVKLLPG